MKLKMILAIVALLICSTSFAGEKVTSKGDYDKKGNSYHTKAIREHVHEYEDTNTHADSDLGNKSRNVELGYSQNLIQFSKHINLQGSVGKDVHGTDVEEGWIIMFYVTNKKPIVDLSNKED